MKTKALLSILAFLAFTNCTKKTDSKPTLWIYTSLYKDVITMMEKKLQTKFPDVEFRWYQSGSENVAARMNAELAAGNTLADLIMTSDPFWYLELKKAGHLLPYNSPAISKLPRRFADADGAFAIVRIPVVVMAYNTELLSLAQAPKAFSDLTKTEWKGKVSMGSPLQSGTAFSAVAQLVRKKGWSYFEQLRKNDLLSAGGNSAVISRIETKERPVGIVLLENVLDAKRRGSPIDPIYPSDGSIMAPSPLAITAKTDHPELAKKVYDYFFDEEMQMENIKGRMYSPFVSIPPPDGARPFAVLSAGAMEWGPHVLDEIYSKRDTIKKQFMKVVLN